VESSGEDPRATGGLVSNLPHPRVNKTKQHTQSNTHLHDVSDSPSSKKQKQTPSHLLSDLQSSTGLPSRVDFKCVTTNINGFSQEKWKRILSLPVTKSVSVIILTEPHLSATFRPKEVIESGWNLRAVEGVPKRRSKQHQHRGGLAILYRNTENLKIGQHRIIDGANRSSH